MRKISPFLVLCFSLLFSAGSFSDVTEITVRLERIVGKAEIKSSGEKSWIPAAEKMILKEADIVRTKGKGEAYISVKGASQFSVITLEENSQLAFTKMSVDKEVGTEVVFLQLTMGKAMVTKKELDGRKSVFEIKTPTSIVSVLEGKARFSVEVQEIE